MARQGIGPGQARWSSARKEQPAQAAAVVLQIGDTRIITTAGRCITTTFCRYKAAWL